MDKKRLSYLQMIVCAGMWSICGVCIKFIPYNPFIIAGGRGFIAVLVMLLSLKLMKVPLYINRRTVSSGCFIAATSLCFVCANKLTTAANAIVLQFTTPVFILAFSVLFLHSRLRRADLWAVLLTLLGIAMFFLDQLAPSYIAGNLLSIAAGGFKAGMLLSMSAVDIRERLSCSIIGQSLVTLVCLPFWFIYPPELTFQPVLFLLILGVLQMGLPFILLAKVQEYCPPLACSLLSALEPLLNPIWVFLFYGEAPGAFALLGGVIVIATVAMWCVYDARPDRKTA